MARAILLLALVAVVYGLHKNPWADCPIGHLEFTPNQWNYGPQSTMWGSLCPAWATCNNGQMQSPINIPSAIAPKTSNLELYLNETGVNIVRVDGVVSMPVSVNTGRLHWRHQWWTLEKIEFHHPSEHTFDGQHSAFEVQLYFGRQDEHLRHVYAAVAVLFEAVSWDNEFLDTLVPLFPRVTTCKCGNGRTENYDDTQFQEECDCGPLNNATADAACRPNCMLAACGDGNTDLSLGEECDAGAANSNSGNAPCRNNCTLPKCGDNIVDTDTETCDIGHITEQPQNGPYFICDSFCQASCGNGIIDPYLNTTWQEECDYGDDNSDAPNAICRSNCLFARCGDEILDAGEDCDLGTFTDGSNIYYGGSPIGRFTNNTGTPNCRANCTAPICGDSIVDNLFGEECDNGGVNNSASQCTFDCLFKCGDGVIDDLAGEQCDNGADNSNLADACRPNCRLPICGDGIWDTGEQCDLGLAANGGGNGGRICDVNCRLRCGNEFVDPADVAGNPAEECDNGPKYFLLNASFGALRDNGNDNLRPNACREDCTFATCGDGVIDPLYGEQCDDTTAMNVYESGACRPDCRKPCCGDGITDGGIEECDHGAGNGLTNLSFPPLNWRDGKNPRGNNHISNWGCSSDCQRLCGNGIRGDWDNILGMGEQCDDGTLNSDSTPDKCRPNCEINFCGDEITDFDEECDDGPSGSPKCTSTCTRKFCGDSNPDYELGEECDNGPSNSYSAASITGCSPICTWNRCGLTQNFGNRISDFDLADLVFSSPMDKSFKPTPTRPGSYFHYEGSQTKPPCTENVDWLVLSEKQTIGIEQLAKWNSGMNGLMNARPTQHLQSVDERLSSPLDDRTLGAPMWFTQPAICGNGIVEYHEECDAGMWNNNLIPNRCRTSCRLAHCGDGVVDQGEECDGEDWCSWCHKTSMVSGHKTEYNNTYTCPYWNYDYAHLWGKLGEGCEACDGNRQSPINIDTNCEGAAARPLSLNHESNIQYVQTPVVLFNTGNNIYFPVLNGGTFSFHGKTYSLKHLEFHAPSEHTIGGKRFDFEVQLHHVAQNPGVEQKAILSVLFEKGAEGSAFLDKFWNQLPPSSECRCGNGIKEDQYYWDDGTITKEECDAGHDNSDVLPNACRTNCLKAHCGDGIVDHNEACDFGSANANLPSHCRPDCTTPYCGDGIIDMGEDCDDMNGNNIDACDNNCRFTCGNGIKEGIEECDHGVLNSDTKANACRTNCHESMCGDGIIDQGEECDNGAVHNFDGNPCQANCTILPWPLPMASPYCGDGIIDAGEECDHGVGNSDSIPNACRSDCTAAKCGDGVRDLGEQCDSMYPWGVGPDQQTNCYECRVVCGNGFLEQDIGPSGWDEECDHGIMNSNENPNACRENCLLAHCGDGVVDPAGPCFEECDNGARNGLGPDQCRPNCRRPYCGDGIVDAGEQCDDGNMIDGDSCNCNCELTCGNGRIDEGEECDDGVWNGWMGGCCRDGCKLPICGDGITDPGEECDDGPVPNDAGAPNMCRPGCKAPKCGDGIVDDLFGEKCDHGPENNELAVDGCSPRCTPNVCGQSLNPDITVTPKEVIPSAPGVYCYDGSVNHPPCTEDAQWFVFAAPQSISECQLHHWWRIIGDNARAVQPLNGRTVSFLTEEARCGDGLVEGNEECDEGPHNSDFTPNGCRRNCRRAYCGDGIQDANEQCDGTPNCGPNCRLSCPAGSSCPSGNGSSMPPSGGGDSNNINVNFGSVV